MRGKKCLTEGSDRSLFLDLPRTPLVLSSPRSANPDILCDLVLHFGSRRNRGEYPVVEPA